MATPPPLFAFPGGIEFAVVLLVFVLLFGAQKIPKLARSTGEALGEFKKGKQDIESELNSSKTPSDAADDLHKNN